ncbi:MAG: MBL fold metallo-hydrolase [Desulfobacterales bacterium]|nr:MBL fold metallo-hydrolase [Desulfobacterales bacterium]
MVIVAKDESVQIDKIELGPFGTNAYVLTCRKTGDSVVVDAPGESGKILARLKGTNPRYILMTHDHLDHVGVLSELKFALNIPVAAHAADALNLPVPPDVLLDDGDVLIFGNIQLKVFHTPGHTLGSLCFLTGKYLISGDTIFPGGPGKTSSPANFEKIIQSITTKIFELPDDTVVYPGHGKSTVLKEEKKAFEVFSSRSHDPNLCGDVLWFLS